MNATALQPDYGNNCPFTFYDEIDKHRPRKTRCKVYNDGGHFIAVPVNQIKERTHSKHEPSEAQEMFDSLYAYTVLQNYGKAHARQFLSDNLCFMFENDGELNDFMDGQIKRKLHNMHERKKRFRRKAYLNNRWNYLVTFTYDGAKCTEEDFRRKLRRLLCNLHTRHGWKYAGVFERAPETGRLHFHALLYVPAGEMVGEIYEKQDYSTKHYKMQTTHENDYFLKRFGRNDFKPINRNQLEEATSYCLKYLEKTGDRITYSRGIPAEIEKTIYKNDIICAMRDFVTKYILFDNVIDYETDVLGIKPPETLFDICPRWLN